MRIVEIRFTNDLGTFKKRKIAGAIDTTVPPVSIYTPRLLKRRIIPEEIRPFRNLRRLAVGAYPTIPHETSGGTFLGTGVLTASGVLMNFNACVLDAVVLQYLAPRALTPRVLMPIAFVTAVLMPNQSVGCDGDTSTIPATGAFQTLVEGNSVPSINQ